MGHKFAEIAFTDTVRAIQHEHGSRAAYARRESADITTHDRLGPAEAAFIAERDSFYMATVGETGWPYVQHRGGPPGFLHVLADKTIGFADFAGNRQYISVGNLATNDRVSLFLMDYPNQTRLKILGRARLIGPDAPELRQLAHPDYKARIERGVLIAVEAFDWNCSQHITPRFTADDVQTAVEALRQRIVELESELQKRQEAR
jgi:predicted pyridoxine 5'-phosphate oxidase superfamily flavin-nucleotide-binding protein